MKQIENVKRKIEESKRDKAELESKKSNAKDDNERRDLEDKIAAKEKEIRELQDKVDAWERKLSNEKTAVSDRIYIGERCLGYREDVARAFQDAKSSAKSESDPQIKPYAQKLVEKYDAGERGHAEAIDITKRASRSARACDERGRPPTSQGTAERCVPALALLLRRRLALDPIHEEAAHAFLTLRERST